MDIRDIKKPKADKSKQSEESEKQVGVVPCKSLPYFACEKCLGCRHLRPWNNSGQHGYFACHYILDVGKMRGCPPEECDKYNTLSLVNMKQQWGAGVFQNGVY